MLHFQVSPSSSSYSSYVLLNVVSFICTLFPMYPMTERDFVGSGHLCTSSSSSMSNFRSVRECRLSLLYCSPFIFGLLLFHELHPPLHHR
ncbi:hypothetical protein HMI56_001212 [Coelomomyces lativittatus]|nr:hypothetical protein HMI56_001212 [Coelomomyces lativittatus]